MKRGCEVATFEIFRYFKQKYASEVATFINYRYFRMRNVCEVATKQIKWLMSTSRVLSEYSVIISRLLYRSTNKSLLKNF